MDFCGKPLLYYTVEIAKKSGLFNTIVVSTDDELAKELAISYGVEVLDRPLELAGDEIETSKVAAHVLQHYLELGEVYDSFATLQVTNPLRTVLILKEAMDAFINNEVDSVVSVSLNKHKLGKIENNRFIPQTYNPGQRSQDLEQLYFENGLIYITKPELILKSDIFGKTPMPLVIEGVFGDVDIDTEQDFKQGEFLLAEYHHLFDF